VEDEEQRAVGDERRAGRGVAVRLQEPANPGCGLALPVGASAPQNGRSTDG
jgi:hypothetical protein